MAEPGGPGGFEARPAPTARGGLPAPLILALVLGQLGVHASMAGLRMGAPLQVLGEGASAGAVGLVLALFAVAPVVLAMTAGRMADRLGFHAPMRVAIALGVTACALALVSTTVAGSGHLALLALGALLSGASANFGVLTIQRTAGLAARDATDRVRLFSWLGMAPSLANVLGPVAVGAMIDLAGFAAAYALAGMLPLLSWWVIRHVPASLAPPSEGARRSTASAFGLLRTPGLKRLLLINWLLATCWDVHGFAVPVLGHGLQFSASTIGLVLGSFTLSVSLVRLIIPWLAHRLRESTVILLCMLGTAALYAVYPLAATPWQMAGLSLLLGITLGSAQPMIMATLHHLTPPGRHGESLALRSMAINLSSVVMPLIFGALGTALGAGLLFWLVGLLVGGGACLARRLVQP